MRRLSPGSRRDFLRRTLGASAGLTLSPSLASLSPAADRAVTRDPAAGSLRQTFPDLERHFVFEYYPWYGGPPDYVHWDYLDRKPPLDLASRYYPRLGPYDVRQAAVVEQHARWIRDAGVGAVALSWWGRGSWEDRAVPLILDVLAAHDLKATFALEPYTDSRGSRYADDVMYLLTEYGEKRKWDAFLLLQDANGRTGPVFKSFATILPETSTDCLGETSPVGLYTPDHVWREQTDTLRRRLRADFDHVTLLADSLEFARTPASGFDGIGTYDNYLTPDRYRPLAEGASAAGLLFSFHVNPGYDQIEPREPDDPCYGPRAFAPAVSGLDFTTADGRERAAAASAQRIRDSWTAALDVQRDTALANARRGFLLIYVNSFNEWHEGHAFEPMADAADLTSAQKAQGYRDPAQGDYRLKTLGELQRSLLSATPADAGKRHPRPAA
ncbi:MAG: hypothetical protein U0599_11610 [Vicinamibacteria bacterium]